MPADLSALLDLSGTTHTNAGTYANDPWTFAGNNNYNPAAGTVSDHIGKAAPAVTATGNTCTYSGSPRAGGGTATGVEGADLGPVTLTYTPGGVAPVNAGSYTIVASIAETANHTARRPARPPRTPTTAARSPA